MDQPEVEEEYEDMEDAVKQSQNESDQIDTTVITTASAEGSAEDEEMSGMVNSSTIRTSSLSGSDQEAEGGAPSTATSHPVSIVASARAPINMTLPESIIARSATPTSTAQFALAAGVLNDGPATPMNDVGPFLFDNTTARRTRPVDSIAREVVSEETEDGDAMRS